MTLCSLGAEPGGLAGSGCIYIIGPPAPPGGEGFLFFPFSYGTPTSTPISTPRITGIPDPCATSPPLGQELHVQAAAHPWSAAVGGWPDRRPFSPWLHPRPWDSGKSRTRRCCRARRAMLPGWKWDRGRNVELSRSG